jgi:hypothetical protein
VEARRLVCLLGRLQLSASPRRRHILPGVPRPYSGVKAPRRRA